MSVTITLLFPDASTATISVHTIQPLLCQIRAMLSESVTQGGKIRVTRKCKYLDKTDTAKKLGIKNGDQLKISYKLSLSNQQRALRAHMRSEGFDPSRFMFLDDSTAVSIFY